MNVTQVTVQEANIKAGHGIRFNFKFRKAAHFQVTNDDKFYIDFHGDYWAALPPGASSLADWMLPLKITRPTIDFPVGSEKGSFSFILGAKGLSHQLLLSTLNKLKNNGDPGLIFEILYETKGKGEKLKLCEPTFKASSILKCYQANSKSFNSNINILAKDVNIDSIKRRTRGFLGTAISMARWSILLLIFATICWMLLLTPIYKETMLEKTPPLVSYIYQSNFTFTYKEAIPFHPNLRSEAWELGLLQGEMKNYHQLPIPDKLQFLRKASEIVGRDFEQNPITYDEVSNVKKILLEIEQNQGLITKIVGFFTFVNTLWLLAIFGISVSIGPSIYILLKPLRRFFRGLSKWIYKHILLPITRRFHNWGIFELLAWCICGCILIDSQRIPLLNDISYFICISALAIAGPCYAYTTLLHGAFMKSYSAQTITHISNSYIALTVFPLAILYQSNLFGFIFTFAIYAILGFSFIPGGLCYYIGFENEKQLMRVAISSFILLAFYSLFRFFFADPYWLSPFSMSIAVCGGLTMYLALLILSSIHYYHYYVSSYLTRQIPIVITLLLGLFVGNILIPNSGLANTATVFLALYIIEKATDLHHRSGFSNWLLVLFCSVCVYFGALHLHANPQMVVSLLQM